MKENHKVLRVGGRLLLALLTLAAARQTVTARSALPNPAFKVGSIPSDTLPADLNQDGLMDLVVVDTGSPLENSPDRGGISVLLGRSDGTFSPHLFFPSADRPVRGRLADVNEDGKLDALLAYLSYTDFTTHMSVYLGAGDGTFGLQQPVATPADTELMAIGKFDADDRVDFLGMIRGPNDTFTLRAFLSNGDGTFTPAPTISSLLSRIFIGQISVGDFNRDGLDDFVIAGPPTSFIGAPASSFLLFTSQGAGAFNMQSVATAATAYTVKAADFNGDGVLDLAVGCSSDPGQNLWSLFLYAGIGNGTFGTPYLTLAARSVLTTADINSDGRLDLMAQEPFGGEVILLADGPGTYAPPIWAVPTIGSSPVLHDFDGDGKLDLVVADGEANAVFLFYGNGDGTFGPPPLPMRAAFTSMQVARGDFNADGILDVAVADSIAGQLEVFLGLGGGAFGTPLTSPIAFVASGLASGDLNGDQQDDLVLVGADSFSSPVSGKAVILLGQGDGTFSTGDSYTLGYVPRQTIVSDLNGDLHPDIAVVDEGSYPFPYGDDLPAGVSVLLGQGDGSFSSVPFLELGEYPDAMALADFDRDGSVDLILSDFGDPFRAITAYLWFLRGNGDGTFRAPSLIAPGVGFAGVASGDLDHDGYLDLAVTDTGNYFDDYGHVSVFLGRGNGTFVTGLQLPAGSAPYDIVMADLNSDSNLDMAVASNAYLSFFPGRGDGTFSEEMPLGFFGALSIVADDFNSDDLTDALVGCSSGSFLLLNQGPAQRVVDVTLARAPSGSYLVGWRTTMETDLGGFNVIEIKPSGAVNRLNAGMIPCEECTTGVGHQYSLSISRPKNANRIYVEMVHRDGAVERFGPASRLRRGGSATSTVFPAPPSGQRNWRLR
jgi:hypothetical protein